jgi:hypothetical protein
VSLFIRYVSEQYPTTPLVPFPLDTTNANASLSQTSAEELVTMR